MPGLDKTGPQGNGPMTGRAQGTCRQGNFGRRQSDGSAFGRGRGQGGGFRCGMGNRMGRRNSFGPNQPRPIDEE